MRPFNASQESNKEQLDASQSENFYRGSGQLLYYRCLETNRLFPVCHSSLRVHAIVSDFQDKPIYRLVQFYGRRRGTTRIVLNEQQLNDPKATAIYLRPFGIQLIETAQAEELLCNFIRSARAAVYRMPR